MGAAASLMVIIFAGNFGAAASLLVSIFPEAAAIGFNTRRVQCAGRFSFN
jgi:hypothetical protein